MKTLAVAALALTQFAADAPIGPGESRCNGDYCIVRAVDWADWLNMRNENQELRQMMKTVKCASVTVLEPPRR